MSPDTRRTLLTAILLATAGFLMFVLPFLFDLWPAGFRWAHPAEHAAYERMMGTWSRLVGSIFLDWLAPQPGLKWLDLGCGNGAFTEMIVERCARDTSQLPALLVFVDLLARAVDSVLLGVEQLAHEHDQLDLTPLIYAITGPVLSRMQKSELTLPVSEHVWL